MLIVDVDLITVKDCCVACIGEFGCAHEGRFSDAGGDVCEAGARTFVASSPISLASSVPLSRRKTLFDRQPVFANGSVGVPTMDVAPLSTTADGIDPSSTPRRSSLSSWRYVR